MLNKEAIETTIDLRKIHPTVKIIAISGGGRRHPSAYLKMAEKLGANQTIENPFERYQILSTKGFNLLKIFKYDAIMTT